MELYETVVGSHLQDADRRWGLLGGEPSQPGTGMDGPWHRELPKTPEERVASAEMVGGTQALQAQLERNVEGPGGGGPKRLSNREKREAKKRRIATEREELARLRGEQKDGGKAGKGKGKSKDGGVQLCFAWNNNSAPCKDVPPGGECQNKVKRAHRCTKCGSPGHQSINCSQG